MNYINIGFVTDNSYFEHMFVAIESILANTSIKRKLFFYILDLGISKKNINNLKDRYKKYNTVDFKFIKVDENKLSNYKLKTHVSSTAYAKIYLCDLVSVDKLIYLDCDIVVNSDISDLWNEFENNLCIKATWNPFYDYDNKYIGVNSNEKTFNSGVMLINLDLMRQKNSSSKLKEFIEKYHEKTKLHDQAAFNAVFKDDWRELDFKWNVQVSMLQNNRKRLNFEKDLYFQLYKNPNITHFTSNSKPWQFRNNHPQKKVYQKYYFVINGKRKNENVNFKSIIQFIRESIKYKWYYIINLYN